MKYKLTIETDNVSELVALLQGHDKVHTCEELETTSINAEVYPDAQVHAANNIDTQVHAVSSILDVDSTGLPWDERIHASSKSVNSDGTWRKRRGLDDITVQTIEAELRNPPFETMGTPIAEPGELPTDFNSLMSAMTEPLRNKTITPDYLNDLVNRVNETYNSDEVHLSGITDIAKYPFLVPFVAEHLRTDGKI